MRITCSPKVFTRSEMLISPTSSGVRNSGMRSGISMRSKYPKSVWYQPMGTWCFECSVWPSCVTPLLINACSIRSGLGRAAMSMAFSDSNRLASTSTLGLSKYRSSASSRGFFRMSTN